MTDRRRSFVITGVLAALVGICMAIALFVSLAYDDGLLCFFLPGYCRQRQATAHPLALSTLPPPPTTSPAAPIITRTLLPTPTQWLTPSPEATQLPVYFTLIRDGKYEEISCGEDPYQIDTVKGEWQRPFVVYCYEHTGNDPFERVFGGNNGKDGLTYGDVLTFFDLIGLREAERDEQMALIESVGLWDGRCECVPDSAPDLNEVIYEYLAGAGEGDADKDADSDNGQGA